MAFQRYEICRNKIKKERMLTFDKLDVWIVIFAFFVLCIRFRHAVMLITGRNVYVPTWCYYFFT